jgi:hypothetical protein
VPSRSQFEQRELLSVPEYFGVHENVEWLLARCTTDAVRLARAHERAYAIWIFVQLYRERFPRWCYLA